MKVLLPLLCALGAATALQSQPAQASHWSNAVDVCQGSLPSYEGALRKRPLAIKNEGSITAFVSCSLESPLGLEVPVGVLLLVSNANAGPVQLNCTLVDGLAPASPIFHPKTILVAANSATITTWTAEADNGGDPFLLPNLNCTLPPNVEINTLEVDTEIPAP